MPSTNEQSDVARLVAASTTGAQVGPLWTTGDLRSAIRGQNLDIAYQPVLDLRTGRIVALEAFARWTTASGSTVSPDVFIPMAEESGMIGELGAQVLRRATRAAARWQSIAPTSVRVNVSAREVEAPGFYEDVMRTLSHADLSPALLGLELDDPLLLAEGTPSATTLGRLRSAGVQLLLDDVGGAISSLPAHAPAPAVDVLKVGRTVVAADDAADVLASVAAAARSLGILVSAEGVEDAGQHLRVVDAGCDQAQGYFFARPIMGSWAPFLPAARPQS